MLFRSPVEERLASHFFFGKGTNFFLTPEETFRLNQNPKTSEFNFGIGKLNSAPNGRVDLFDFDPKPVLIRDDLLAFGTDFFTNRTPIGEIGTRFGNYLGETFGGQSFEIFPTLPISQSISNGGASGGFVLYPNKPNTNFMTRVYSK